MHILLSMLLTAFTFVQLNCENLFDWMHDEGKEDTEFLPESPRHWNKKRFWHKLNHLSQDILACGNDTAGWHLPSMVALCEVENDTALHYLTKRGPLRKAGYEYVMTSSPDVRGIDVALLYSPFAFSLIEHKPIRVTPLEGMRPTRDILYAKGRIANGDTLHVFVVHAPSRYGGEKATRPFRMAVAKTLCVALDSIFKLSPGANIIVSGDFNDYHSNPAIKHIMQHNMAHLSHNATGKNGLARGTYKYKGQWNSIDHIFASETMRQKMTGCFINDAPFLMENDTKYGGKQPLRNYNGYRYNNGYSDHLPLVVSFNIL